MLFVPLFEKNLHNIGFVTMLIYKKFMKGGFLNEKSTIKK